MQQWFSQLWGIYVVIETIAYALAVHFNLSPPEVWLRITLSWASSWDSIPSYLLSPYRKNKQSSMRTLWRSWGQSQTISQWATMDKAILHSSGFVFATFHLQKFPVLIWKKCKKHSVFIFTLSILKVSQLWVHGERNGDIVGLINSKKMRVRSLNTTQNK